MKKKSSRKRGAANRSCAGPSGSPLLLRFNINEYVRVRLTARGKKCLRENYDRLAASYGGHLTFPFRIPKEDKDGWSRWQMWSLMEDLGPHVSIGCEPPFETTIIVETDGANGPDEGRREKQSP